MDNLKYLIECTYIQPGSDLKAVAVEMTRGRHDPKSSKAWSSFHPCDIEENKWIGLIVGVGGSSKLDDTAVFFVDIGSHLGKCSRSLVLDPISRLSIVAHGSAWNTHEQPTDGGCLGVKHLHTNRALSPYTDPPVTTTTTIAS